MANLLIAVEGDSLDEQEAVLRLREGSEGYPMLNWDRRNKGYKKRVILETPEKVADIRQQRRGGSSIEDIPDRLEWMLDEFRRARDEGVIEQARKKWSVNHDKVETFCGKIGQHEDGKVKWLQEEDLPETEGGDVHYECPECGETLMPLPK